MLRNVLFDVQYQYRKQLRGAHTYVRQPVSELGANAVNELGQILLSNLAASQIRSGN